ncbi:MAG: prephenate dehydrogenase [Tenuifilaceae bacterium]
MENISIIGTGMIGCSIALGVKGLFRNIAGFDTNPQNLDYAIETGIINHKWSIEKISQESDFIVLAVPVDVAIKLLPGILNKTKANAVVIDVGSTKSSICNSIQHHPKRGNFVATHPMAGNEIGGPRGAEENLFRGRKLIICQSEKSSSHALNLTKRIFESLGMTIEYMDENIHDNIVALTSHLPQLVSFGIANTVNNSMIENRQWCKLAASGFDSSTRLAKSSSEVWTPILMQNKEHINQYLDLFIGQIEAIKKMINENDITAIDQYINQAQSIREIFKKNQLSKINPRNGNKTITRTCTTQVVVAGIEQ